MLYTKYQQNISCGSGEKVDFIGSSYFLATAAIFDSGPG